MASYVIDMRFRVINDWCVKSGIYRAGWPTFYDAIYGNPEPQHVYGHSLLKDQFVDWQDVPRDKYNDLRNPRTTLASAHDYAVSIGYQTGFPNFHQADYGQGVVYGTFLIPPGTCEFRDVPASELGLLDYYWYSDDPNEIPLYFWFQGAASYAARHGYAAGLPDGHYANYGNGYVCGIFLFPQGTAEFRDIRGRELDLPDEYPSSGGGSSGGNTGGNTGGNSNPPPPPSIADLTFINTWTDPSFPTADKPFVVYFSFSNIGNVATSNFTARLQLDNNASVKDIPVSSFASGRVDTLYWYFPSGLPEGSHFIYAYLDINNQVKEVTKQNNISYNGFSVGTSQ